MQLLVCVGLHQKTRQTPCFLMHLVFDYLFFGKFFSGHLKGINLPAWELTYSASKFWKIILLAYLVASSMRSSLLMVHIKIGNFLPHLIIYLFSGSTRSTARTSYAIKSGLVILFIQSLPIKSVAHHLLRFPSGEHHVQSSPTAYLLWRFAYKTEPKSKD